MKHNPVVITGAAIVTALGHTVSETWENLLAGRQGIGPIRDFDAAGFPCKVAAQVRALDTTSLDIEPRSERIMDLHSYMLMKCAIDAFLDAGLQEASIRDEDVGLFLGMGMVDFKIADLLPATLASRNESEKVDLERFYSRGYREIYPFVTLSMLNNISACQAAIRLNIRGENAIFSPHADAGAQAIAEGAKTVLEKKAKMVLAGGVSEKVSPLGLARAHLQRILNQENDLEGPWCRPFGARRAGTVLGEGCGIVCLELRDSAEKREALQLASIAGCGAAFQAEEGRPAPTRRAIARAMQSALQGAELAPSDIDVIIAHGAGTSDGDENEADAIHEVFRGSSDRLVVYSSKGALGHMLAAAPAADVILGLNMLRRGWVPPTLHCCPLAKGIRFKMAGDGPTPVTVRRVLINCHSEEGQCASIVLESAHE